MTDMPHFSLYVAGSWRAGGTSAVMQSINPATGTPWAMFDCAFAGGVDDAVAAARAALDTPQWRDITATARGKLL